jgi:uncharacterized membrane protein YjjP (DUF1212 family)
VQLDDDSVGFVLRLGRALHMYGYTAHGLEGSLGDVAARLGLDGSQFFATPTFILAAFGAPEQQRTHLIRVEPGDLNLGKLAALDDVTDQVLESTLSPAQGSAQVDAIVASPARYNRLVETLAYGFVSAAACRILDGGFAEIAMSSIVGLVTGVLAIGSRGVRDAITVFPFVAAAIAAFLVNAAGASGVSVSTSTTILAGLVVLLPGLSLTLAMAELSSQHLIAGTARLAGAFTVFVGIAFGVALGTQLARLIFGAAPNIPTLSAPTWTLWVALLAAPVVFSVLLRARPRDIGAILAVSVIGYGGAQLGAHVLGPQLGGGLGALSLAMASNLYERWTSHPATVTLVPGVLLLVPGSIGFRSFSLLLEQQVVVGVDAAFTMTMTAISLVAGLLLANILVPANRRPSI